MFQICCVKKDIHFHSLITANKGRGFGVSIVLVYNQEAEKDLENSQNKDNNNRNYQNTIKDILSNSPGAIEVVEIDINPTKKHQKTSIDIKKSVINCFIFAHFQSINILNKTKIKLGKLLNNKTIHIFCSENGINIKRIEI